MSVQTLSVTLPSSTLYVVGTVNGAASTWTNTTGYIWETAAPRSDDDVYRVELTLVSSTGLSSETSFTLYYGLHLVTDRTQADVQARNEKGTYNASDLNRVGAAMEYVADRMREQGFWVDISPKTDWTEDDWPTPANMTHYLNDLSTMRNMVATLNETPKVPEDMVRLTYVEANNIEEILEDLDYILTQISLAWFLTAEVSCGEV